MPLEDPRARRVRLNERMGEADAFFREFGALDDAAYAEGPIGRKHKELMGLAISAATRCEECVLYHLDGCREEGAIKIGVFAGGSATYPTARFAFAALDDEVAWRVPLHPA